MINNQKQEKIFINDVSSMYLTVRSLKKRVFRMFGMVVVILLFINCFAGCAKNTPPQNETEGTSDGLTDQTETVADVFNESNGINLDTHNDVNQPISYSPEVDLPLSAGFQDPQPIGDKTPISRAMAAKTLSLAMLTMNAINNIDLDIGFNDVSADDWYYKYIRAGIFLGYFSGDTDVFLPEKALTTEQAQILITRVNPGTSIKLNVTNENKDKPLSYAAWIELYQRLLDEMRGNALEADQFGIQTKNLVILATQGTNNQLSNWKLISATGPIGHDGLMMDGYVDAELCLLTKDSEIVGICSLVSTTPLIDSVYIVKNTENSVTIFSGGIERTYGCKLPDHLAPGFELSGMIGKVIIGGGNCEIINIYTDKLVGVMKKVSANEIDIDDNRYQVGETLKIYSVAGTESQPAVKWKSISSLIVGTDTAVFYLNNGVIIGAVIVKTPSLDKLRIAISDTGFGSLLHQSVSLTATGDFIVAFGAKETTYKAGETFTVAGADSMNGASRIYIKTLSEDSRIKISSIKRAYPNNESPQYRGVMEISRENGGFYLVNEIGIEEYLYSVVPSEMPSSFGVEASKAQAVTARSYAYNQYFTNRYHYCGANIDDSVNCQVYNNIPENETSIKAVNDTKNLYLTYHGSVISANYFSTSAGMTANNGEVWASGGEFPVPSSSYLRAKKQYDGEYAEYADLTKETSALNFFKDKSLKAYDKDFPWFRWSLTMSAEDITASLDANLSKRYNANPLLIKTLQNDGTYKSVPVRTIGTITDIEVMKRGQGGNIMQMRLTGSEATVIVNTELNIRYLLTPKQYKSGGNDITITRVDGSAVKNYSLMPSAFFAFEKSMGSNGSLSGITIYGGGNGHGVGMSQNGVKGLIDRGYNYTDVLNHYYSGTKVTEIR